MTINHKMEKIKELIEKQEYQDAFDRTEILLKEQPEDLELLCMKADILKKLNKFTDAINLYIVIIDKYPDYKKAQVEKDLLHVVMLQDNKDIFACTNLHDDPWA